MILYGIIKLSFLSLLMWLPAMPLGDRLCASWSRKGGNGYSNGPSDSDWGHFTASPDMVALFYPCRWSYPIPTLLPAYAETMCVSRILPELKTWSWKSQPQVNYHPTNIADHIVEVHDHTLCHLSQPLQALVWGDLFVLLVNVVINRAILSKLWIRNLNEVTNILNTSNTVMLQQFASEITFCKF